MLKNSILLLLGVFVLNSCETLVSHGFSTVTEAAIIEANNKRISKKKDGEYAIRNPKHKSHVLRALKNVTVREINKNFDITKNSQIVIPEGIDLKENLIDIKDNDGYLSYHLVDARSGYGLPIYIDITGCGYNKTGRKLRLSYDIQSLDEEGRKLSRELIEKLEISNPPKCENNG